nr:MAG TPA: hypothetical protein [Caudoviricetes sp.]
MKNRPCRPLHKGSQGRFSFIPLHHTARRS